MIIRIEKERFNDGAGNVVVDIHVDSTSDLPALGGSLADHGLNRRIMATSIASTKDGTFYKLHTDGKWYVQDGSGDSVTPSED